MIREGKQGHLQFISPRRQERGKERRRMKGKMRSEEKK